MPFTLPCRYESPAQQRAHGQGRATWMHHEHDMRTASRAFPKATQIFSRPRPMRGTRCCVTRLLLLRDGSMNNAPKKGKKRRASSRKHPQPRRCSVLPTLNNPIYPPILRKKQTNACGEPLREEELRAACLHHLRPSPS